VPATRRNMPPTGMQPPRRSLPPRRPVYAWTPAIASAEAIFYEAEAIQGQRGSLLLPSDRTGVPCLGTSNRNGRGIQELTMTAYWGSPRADSNRANLRCRIDPPANYAGARP
jgi:hypothetical protein